jgi:hypothetical protein
MEEKYLQIKAWCLRAFLLIGIVSCDGEVTPKDFDPIRENTNGVQLLDPDSAAKAHMDSITPKLSVPGVGAPPLTRIDSK